MSRRRAVSALLCLAVIGGFTVALDAIPATSANASGPTSGYPLGFGNDAAGQIGSGKVNDGTPSPTAAQLPAGVTAIQVAAGNSHTVALGSDGLVYAWGDNTHGELGNGTTTASSTPTPVSLPGNATITSVSAGYLDSFAVTSAGAVYAWGYGATGELGDGGTADVLTPAPVSLPSGVSVTSVSAGYTHTLAVTTSGAVYAWGTNGAGQLGDGTHTSTSQPVKTALPTGTIATAVSAGYGHSLALTSTGGVLAWGANDHGQLGTGNLTASATPVAVGLAGAHATSVAAGFRHSAATTATGSALAWGDNGSGELGTGQPGSTLAQSVTPVAMSLAGASATSVAAGAGFTLVLTSSGSVLGAGDNTYGELGTGNRTSTATPVSAALPAGPGASAVVTSSFSLTAFVLMPAAATTTTVTSSTPEAAAGQAVTFTATVTPNSGLGTVTFTSGDTATPLPGCSALPLRAAAGGSFRATCSTASLPVGTTAIGADYAGGVQYQGSAGVLPGGQTVHAVNGVALGWGGNSSGQVGNGTTTNQPTPVAASFPAGTSVVQVAGGGNHAVALLSDGSIYAWGDNTYGELGTGGNTASTTPVRVILPVGVTPVSVAAGAFTSAFVGADGSLYTWGLNNVGQLGVGTNTSEPIPTQATFPTGTVITAVSFGAAHLLALTSTGAVYAAGGNTAGQLGNNTVSPAAVPVPVHLPVNVSAVGVAGGQGHSLAVTSDGTVLAWGDNSHGELGNGATSSAVVPVAVTLPAGTAVVQVSAGYYDSLATTSTGGALAWGDNATGELGTGTTTDANVPTAVALPSGTHIRSVVAGSKSSYALADDGTVLAWGDNSVGSLGDGTTTAHLTPAPVHLPAGGAAAATAGGGSGTTGYALMPRVADQVSVSSSANPSTVGRAVTFTATVVPADGVGTVAFTADGTAITGCTAVVLTAANTASCTTSALSPGDHAIAASYTGDNLYLPATGTLTGGQTVDRIVTTTKLTTSAAKIAYQKSVTFTATVTGSDGHGTVAFASDGTTIGGCSAIALANVLGKLQAKCSTAALAPGQHVITATYSGDALYAPSTATLTGGELITAATKMTASAVTITTAQGLPTYRGVLTVAADGTPVPGMTVTFTLNSLYGTSSCTATTDSSGVATCQGARPRRSGGQYTAKFAGTTVYGASSGSATVTF